MKRPFSDYKHDKRLLFERGMVVCKGTRALVGYNDEVMNLLAEGQKLNSILYSQLSVEKLVFFNLIICYSK